MRFLSVIVMAISLVACSKPSPNTLTIGTISGPETDLVEVAKNVALNKYGLTIKIIEFSDYNLPNEALQDGSLDANVYQHLPYLQSAIKAHGYDLEYLGETVRQRVMENSGVRLDWEIKRIGAFRAGKEVQEFLGQLL